MLETPEDSGPGSAWTWEAPENGWPTAAPPEGLVGEGLDPGQVAPDFLLPDQHGDHVSLWQFYGSVVVVDISTMWCAPCRELASHTEETYQDYIDDDVMYLTVLPEDVEGQDPDLADLNTWADAFGITAPVIGDPGKVYSALAVRDGQYPVVLILDRDMTVAARLALPSDDNVRAEVDALIE